MLYTQTYDDEGFAMRITFGLVLTFVLFSIVGMCSIATPQASEWLAMVLIIVAGIPHGSYDVQVAKSKWTASPRTLIAIITLYVISAIVITGLCVFFPYIGFPLFIALSALHFSEGESDSHESWYTWRSIVYGTSPIVLPIGLHPKEAAGYINFFIGAEYFDSMGSLVSGIAAVCTLCLAYSIITQLKRDQADSSTQSLERLICLLGWIVLPPLSGFAVWFIGRHSRIHIEHCKAIVPNTRTISSDFIIISVLAIAGLLPFTLLFDLSNLRELFTASVCLIAGLTLPHMIVSHGMYGKTASPDIS